MTDPSYAELSRTCSEYLATHRAQVAEAIAAGQRGPAVAERYARVFDGLLGSLFCGALAEIRRETPDLGRVALVAVGGYGRRMVAPHSDIDVLFLSEEPGDENVASLAERVLYPLWNASVDVGHAVRGLAESIELSHSDIRTSTTLLDMRHIAGDRALTAELAERGRDEIFKQHLVDFVSALEQDTGARHERYGGSLYVREPDLKLGRGGLRDMDVVLWCAAARDEAFSGRPGHRAALLSDRETEDLDAATDHLWTARNRLHLSARRRNDRLSFDEQQQIAAAFGYRDGMMLAAEQLMQAHYRHSRAVARLVDRIGDRVRRSLRPPPTTIRDLGDGILVHDRRITIKPLELRRSPEVAFRLYRHAVREGLPPDPEARDEISSLTADLEWCRRLRRAPEAARLFLRLMMHSDNALVRRGSLLDEFHETGLLLAMIPELEAITGRVRHDAYHAYTVDAQAVMAVDKLRALVRGELASEYFVVSRCAAEMPRSPALFLALVLAGLGDGHPDDPAKYGAAIAGPIAERLGLELPEVQHTQWLIASQFKMYHAAMRRDITDPNTIREVAEDVQNVRRMGDLYLLTFCSVATANPTAMSAWNARMLGDLWRAVCDHIEGLNESRQLERLRVEVLSPVEDTAERARLERFIDSMPERYLMANSSEGIRRHAALAERAAGGVVFDAAESGIGEGTLEIVIGCPDRPGLLADLTAALAALRFSVDSAQVYTRRQSGQADQAFDLFHVTHPNMGSLDLIAVDTARLHDSIEALLSGRVTAALLLGRRSAPPAWARTGPRIKTEIHVDNGASPRYTVVDIYTRDRPDLLHVIASTLHDQGLSIHLAKVNTEGQRVADVFYVQTDDGQKLQGEGRLSALSAALRRTIRELH